MSTADDANATRRGPESNSLRFRIERTNVRVYLSGPMKGYPDSNFPAFHATAAALRARGLEVVNPAEIGVSTAENDPGFYNACMHARPLAVGHEVVEGLLLG